MACCGGGHPEDRFQTSVDKNFFCPICTDVLKDPVQCHNQHLFCRACITEHLKNSQTCPVCMQELTEEALSKPRPVATTDKERGCVELVELGLLETHISVCEYKPVTCPNERCEAVVNKADLEEHTSEDYECRQVFCEECDENMSLKKYGKHGCFISKDVQAIKVVLFQMQDQIKEVQDQVKEMSNKQNEMFEAIQNLTTAVSKLSNTKPQGNIVVIGGQNDAMLNSVEKYSLANQTWSKLAPMQQQRASATAHLYNGRVMVTGGYCDLNEKTGSIEYVQIHKETSNDISECENLPLEHSNGRRLEPINRAHLDEFSVLPSQLPFACSGHKTTILNDHLWIVGGNGMNQRRYSNAIHMMSVHSIHTVIIKCRMPKPLSYHGLEVVGNELLIIGGTTTGMADGIVGTVLSYHTATNALREVHPLPFPMADMATVKHGEDVIIIGGINKDHEYLNTIFKYNHKKRVCKQLRGMKHKRAECAAVLSGNKVFVMGGNNSEQGCLSSVECFDLDLHVWYELPSMSEAKYKLTAVLVP
ncbi:E3 ubiquitin- ligase PDZRN3-like [Paramuricea clavata]|uniref:E3 ubiquitin- ligase PDZRN3-like n=1 Tax=Paramuricea clavata TaxID=317549 RepID=A0A6S7JRV9_PARCT|nr:E3 ubiquitin- ligase PDZRN3-like [Paramuricea clavata]